jgi:hypothetical protein
MYEEFVMLFGILKAPPKLLQLSLNAILSTPTRLNPLYTPPLTYKELFIVVL